MADLIVVLDGGEVVAAGSDSELVAEGGTHAAPYGNQARVWSEPGELRGCCPRLSRICSDGLPRATIAV